MPVFRAFSAPERRNPVFFDNNWSIIPLIGGPDSRQGKRPAIRWQVYTRRRPSSAELHAWFGDDSYPAYGIVCGQISGLVVLDLDDPALADRFLRDFPQLFETLVVRSGLRGTPHLYWQVDFPVKTRAFPGGDLKAEGSYIVGPGSEISGVCWSVAVEKPVRSISPDELRQVLAFLCPTLPSPAVKAPVSVSAEVYPGLYQQLIGRLQGRNKALFTTACAMRDAGCSQDQALETLGSLHARQTAPDKPKEAYLSRYAEAKATIHSAYSRPPRRKTLPRPPVFCPNAVREALLVRSDGAAILRTLEAAYLKGVLPGAVLTEGLLCQMLEGIVSRESIRKALQACYDDAQPIFYPPGTPPALAEIPGGIERQKHAFLSGGQKRTKPARQFCLPSPAQLCKALKLAAKGGDPVTLDDLRSARAYRQALHRALLQRRPGLYSQALLAHRLGISRRSLRRYHRQMPVKSQPSYQETPILWLNIEQLPPGEDLKRYQIPTGGQFLLDDSGKRWPLKREIAAHLLRQGRRVSHMRQGVNHYSYDSLPAQPGIRAAALSTAATQPAANHAAVIGDSRPLPPLQPPFESVREAAAAPFWASSPPPGPQNGVKGPSKRKYRRPLDDLLAEQAARKAARQIGSLSLPNARRLAETYDPQSLDAALRKLVWLQARRDIDNPAAYLVTLARVSWRARHPKQPAPRFKAEPARPSRQDRYVAPQDDPLWKSAVYQDWRAEFFGWDHPAVPGETDEELPY